MPITQLAPMTRAFSFVFLYMLDINNSSMITIGAVIVSVVWFKRSLHRQGLLAPARA